MTSSFLSQNTVIEPNYIRDLPIDARSTMMMGMDLSHPDLPSHKVDVSVAAAVGSCDSHMSHYACSVAPQTAVGGEVLSAAADMTEALMNAFKESKGNYPNSLILFRLGASDGQLKKITEVEVPAVEAALRKLSPSKVKLTFIVVTRGHSVRFALTKVNTEGARDTFNVASGTVVDGYITDPTVRSFYLNSHFSPLVSLGLLF